MCGACAAWAQVVQERVEEMSSLIMGQEDEQAVQEVQKNVMELSKLAEEKEGEAGLETEQQREQEQERQQEQEPRTRSCLVALAFQTHY